jgi:hypothetical protein
MKTLFTYIHQHERARMNEFMLFVRTEGDPDAELSPEQMQQHVQKVNAYIENLVKEGKLKGVQPLAMEGVIISGTRGVFNDGPFNESKEVIAGYYHILAKDLREAVAIAKSAPQFDEERGWKIEVRPIKKVAGLVTVS